MFSSELLGVCVEFTQPIKKWFGVSGSSSNELMGISVRGLEFIIFSASISKLLNVSTLGAVSFNVLLRILFIIRISRSQTPPELGFPGQLKSHSIFLFVASSCILSTSKSLFSF